MFSLIKGLFSLIKSLFSLIKSLFSLIKGLFSTTLTLGFTGVPECLKYLNILKFLNSSVRGNFALFFGFYLVGVEKIFQLKKQKGKNSWNENKKQNLKLGEETPAPGGCFLQLIDNQIVNLLFFIYLDDALFFFFPTFSSAVVFP